MATTVRIVLCRISKCMVMGPTHALAEEIGGCYDTPALVTWLGISKQALAKRVSKRRILGCQTSDGYWVYPAWQFVDDGSTVPGLTDVLDVLLAHRDAWATARWFVIPSVDLPGAESAISWLRAGKDLEPVLAEARRDSEKLAS